jgi:hypothetical protein
MNIPAILDFGKIIEIFINTAQPLLDWHELSELDGQKLMEREQEIRKATLELAGQLIALAISKLSQEPAAAQEASRRTETSRGLGSQSQGKRAVKVKMVGNVEVCLNVDYILSRKPRQGGKKARKKGGRGTSEGQGFHPFLRWLGMEEKVSPLVWSMAASFGMTSSSFAIASGQLEEWGVKLSEQRMQKLTYSFGKIGVELTEQWMEQMRAGQLPVGQTLAGQRVLLSADGGRVRLRTNQEQKVNSRQGFTGDWREPKLFTFYVLNDAGERINTVELPVTNDGTFGDVEVFMELLEMYLVKLGVANARQVLLIADGAKWIWQRIPALLKKLGLTDEQIVELIDFYHAAEHLRAFSELAFSKKKQAKAWFEKARKMMRDKDFSCLVGEMWQMLTSIISKKKRVAAESKILYFSDQPQRFDYSGAKAMNLPIGSGAIESLIRQVVNLRLKSNGKFWLPKNAEIILHGRCQWAAGQWHQFAQRILVTGITPKSLLNKGSVALSGVAT